MCYKHWNENSRLDHNIFCSINSKPNIHLKAMRNGISSKRADNSCIPLLLIMYFIRYTRINESYVPTTPTVITTEYFSPPLEGGRKSESGAEGHSDRRTLCSLSLTALIRLCPSQQAPICSLCLLSRPHFNMPLLWWFVISKVRVMLNIIPIYNILIYTLEYNKYRLLIHFMGYT